MGTCKRQNRAIFRRPAGLPVQVFIILLAAFVIAACGGAGANEGDDNGGGGSGNSGLTGAGNQGNGNSGTGAGSSTSSGSGGGGEVCNPTMENGWCKDAPSCECEFTPFIPDAPCPGLDKNGNKIPGAVGNVCTPGHNQCGCDLPLGEDYMAPDANCIWYIDGDTWVPVGFPDGKGTIGSKYRENGQLYASGIIAPYSEFYNGFVVSARKIAWNLANRDQYDFAEGEFSEDCKTITMRYYRSGENEPYGTGQVVWLHD